LTPDLINILRRGDTGSMANTIQKRDEKGYIIYIDTGGTFSDCIILKPDGTFVSGKAPTTPKDLSKSFFAAIEVAASELGQSADEVLSNTTVLGYGTTEGTNIVVTGTGAARLGLITSMGHEDRILMMRLRAAGLSRQEAIHIGRADKPEPLIPRRRMRSVTERIDRQGRVYIPLREDEVRQAVKELLEEKVEGIAVALLWSFLNPTHERRVAEIIEEMAPGMPVSLSSTVAPLVREFPRTMTTIIDLYIGSALKELL
jgi:N-methylhydantoinase A